MTIRSLLGAGGYREARALRENQGLATSSIGSL
jgi:hypothetical protein